jgi:multiple sugar transport system permease protein
MAAQSTALRGRFTPRQREALQGWLYVSPWVFGFLVFTAGPLLASLALSFTEWGFVDDPTFIGLENYQDMFKDPIFWLALRVTAVFTLIRVPLVIGVSLGAALLMTRKLRGMYIFRTIYYLPAVVGGVPMALIFTWAFQPEFGIINRLLYLLGVEGPNWLGSPQWALFAIVVVSAWNFGLPMVVLIAGLQNIPPVLYEAAALDGATRFRQFWHVTLPMLSPTLFFVLVYQIITSFQTFDSVYVITSGDGRPLRSTLMYLLYFVRNAFLEFKMGYASALVWVLFIIIMAFTLLIFKSSSLWVYYESETKND